MISASTLILSHRSDEIIQQQIGTKVNHRYSTISSNQQVISLDVYASTKEKPTYVGEDGCVLIGTAKIEIPFPSEERRYVLVEYIFGNTGINMTATDEVY